MGKVGTVYRARAPWRGYLGALVALTYAWWRESVLREVLVICLVSVVFLALLLAFAAAVFKVWISS